MAVDTPRRPPERVAPELALAKLDMRDICLLAAFEILTEPERHAHRDEYCRAWDAGQAVIDENATAPDRPLPEVARLFFSFTWAFPNWGWPGRSSAVTRSPSATRCCWRPGRRSCPVGPAASAT